MPKVFLKRGRANPVWRGHPWIYSGAVAEADGNIEPGDVVEVCDTEHRLIGAGFLNPRSQILVRMLTRGPLEAAVASRAAEPGEAAGVATHEMPAVDAVAALIEARIEAAWALRQRLGLPSAETTAFRLVNSEGDGLPGLVVDVYGDVAAVQFTALGMKRQEQAVWKALRGLPLGFVALIETAAGSFAQVEGFSAATRVVWGDATRLSGGVPCLENGIALHVDLEQSQKTGLFLDQRENHLRLARYCRGADVLDVYSYVGGFSLLALQKGARSATCVDSSARALQRAGDHAAKNQLGPLHTVEQDAFRYLEAVTPYRFDVVVVDPPKFARAQRDLPAALKGYQRLNALAMNAVRRGGLLATCSCSQLVDEQSFERLLAAAGQDAGRRVTVLESASQGPDHPVPPAFPEGRYLKFLLLGVD
jgi:23S rRNA (cytosine1962-C5)-methyltransferase